MNSQWKAKLLITDWH